MQKPPPLRSPLPPQKQASGSTYIQGKGLQLLYTNAILDTVFLYSDYSFPLPFHLHKNITLQQVVQLLGQPLSKKGGGLIEIEIDFPWTGLSIVFHSKSWQMSATMKYLYYYEATGQPRCGVCLKPEQGRCGKCKQVWYCSRQCQLVHWTQHKAVCRQE